MKNYKYIIFDLDDTLLDFKDNERKGLEKIFKKYNIPVDEKSFNQYQEINKALWDKLEKGNISKKDVLSKRFTEFFKLYNYEIDGQIIEDEYRNSLNSGHKIIPNANFILSELKSMGYIIFSGTNGVGYTQRKRLKDSDLINYFDDLFISEEVGFEKPNIEFFKSISNKYKDINSANTLMIGDSLNSDIKGANNFSIDSIWFNSDNKENSTIKATFEINSLLEILDILNKE